MVSHSIYLVSFLIATFRKRQFLFYPCTWCHRRWWWWTWTQRRHQPRPGNARCHAWEKDQGIIRLYSHHQLQHQRQKWSKNLHQSKQKLSVSQKSDWSFFKSRFFLLAHRKSRIIDRAGSARATPLVKRSNSSPCGQRTTSRAGSTGLQELENKNVENRTLLRKYFSLPKYHQAR